MINIMYNKFKPRSLATRINREIQDTFRNLEPRAQHYQISDLRNLYRSFYALLNPQLSVADVGAENEASVSISFVATVNPFLHCQGA